MGCFVLPIFNCVIISVRLKPFRGLYNHEPMHRLIDLSVPDRTDHITTYNIWFLIVQTISLHTIFGS